MLSLCLFFLSFYRSLLSDSSYLSWIAGDNDADRISVFFLLSGGGGRRKEPRSKRMRTSERRGKSKRSEKKERKHGRKTHRAEEKINFSLTSFSSQATSRSEDKRT